MIASLTLLFLKAVCHLSYINNHNDSSSGNGSCNNFFIVPRVFFGGRGSSSHSDVMKDLRG